MADEMERRQHPGLGRELWEGGGREASVTGLRAQMLPCSLTVRTSVKTKTLSSYGSLAPRS